MGKKKKQPKEYIPSEHDMSIAEEPRPTYGQALNFETVWAMFKETDRFLSEKFSETDRFLSDKFSETDKQIKENDRLLKEQMQETREQIKENDRLLTEKFQETREQIKENDRLLTEKFRESREQMKETDRKLKELAKMYGGMSKSNADMAESHFYNGLAGKMSLGRVTFEGIQKNLHKQSKQLEGEYDIVLTNPNTVVVIEVKYKLHPNDVRDFLEKLPNFRLLFPEYNNHRLFAGMASFTIPDDSKKLALEHGLFLLLPSGDNIKLLNKKGFVPKEY